ncbi:hypothetical protein [Leifsonia sp. TF02-11]|uniref:hypothetical protein n=1 Tax=Leifsonia sp. TF02-11 TaxID=2815212 RepID=UPI001AA0E6C8|nr:hypothetical protein [Leifsonia sp. TF02-11]MBO1740194.1 hypothetical protein [Leifsonia sp. TF02-11]
MSIPISTDQQQAILGVEVARYISDGWAAESVVGATATLTKNKRIGWFWNTILTLLTAGLWLIVVIYRVVNRKRYTIVLTVDSNGRVRRSDRGGARTSR